VMGPFLGVTKPEAAPTRATSPRPAPTKPARACTVLFPLLKPGRPRVLILAVPLPPPVMRGRWPKAGGGKQQSRWSGRFQI